MTRALWLMAAIALATTSTVHANPRGPVPAPGFLDVHGTEIVDGAGRPLILRGMGLGGWMLQEGYMLRLGELGQQHVIHRRLAELVGEQSVADFQRAWLDNHVTRADVDALGRWGFNSIRLPMHHALFMDPDAPPGVDRFREDAFQRVDALLQWAAANHIWVILDLHAAPGGQGTDLAISDRDPTKASLWDSSENQRRTVALWGQLARRYAGNPWVGGYDIVNEPNWDFDGPGGGHGCNDTHNAPIVALYKRITAAIRAHDKRHIIIIEGNCWGNNYDGIIPDWDPKLVLSFHKYWNRNDDASLAGILSLRKKYGRPIWLGESGENSNAWYRDAIRLVEGHGIGWAWWPLKKLGFNNPLEVEANPGWNKVVAWLTEKGPRPNLGEAREAMMLLATHDIAYANLTQHPDVIDAMMRQPYDDSARPYRPRRLGRGPLIVAAVDYDLGRPGVAYADKIDADYHVATGKDRVEWNDGRTYRNDGVDIAREADGRPYVTAFEAGEWLQYTITADRGGTRRVVLRVASDGPAVVRISVNGGSAVTVPVQRSEWQDVPASLRLAVGVNRMRVGVEKGAVRLQGIAVR